LGSEAYYLVYQNTESLSAAARRFRGWLLEQARAADRLPG